MTNAQRKAQQKYLLSSFYTFCKGTRIIPDIEEQPHREMCDEMEQYATPGRVGDDQKKEIYLAPRGTFKTSIIKAFFIFNYLKNPNIRMVYGRATHTEAKDVLRSIRETIETNVVIRETWGDLRAGARMWAEDAIILPRTNPTLTEPTLDTTGLGLSMTGSHPDLIILDDLVNDVNYESELTIERSRDLLLSAEPVLEKGGALMVSGTRWQPNDVYGWLMSIDDQLEEEGQPRQWHRYIRSVYLDAEHKELFFPTRLNEDFLLQQRRSLATKMRLYSAWYLNQPYEEGTKLFPTGLLQFYTATFYRYPAPYLRFANGEQRPLYVTMTIDPAPTVGKYSDFTGVTVVGTDHDGVWWVLHAKPYKLTPSALASEIYSLILRYEPAVIVIETGNADPEFVARLQKKLDDEEMPMRHKPSITSYAPKTDERRGERGKGARIEALEPYFREEYIVLPEGEVRELLQQLDGYPSLDHDDVIDALSMQRLYVRSARAETVVELGDEMEEDEEAMSWGPEGRPPTADEKNPRRRGIVGGNVGFGSQFMRG